MSVDSGKQQDLYKATVELMLLNFNQILQLNLEELKDILPKNLFRILSEIEVSRIDESGIIEVNLVNKNKNNLKEMSQSRSPILFRQFKKEGKET